MDITVTPVDRNHRSFEFARTMVHNPVRTLPRPGGFSDIDKVGIKVSYLVQSETEIAFAGSEGGHFGEQFHKPNGNPTFGEIQTKA